MRTRSLITISITTESISLSLLSSVRRMAAVGRDSCRLKTLATPKSLPAAFHEDRRSVYWDNGIPSKDYSKTTAFMLSERQGQLAYSKRLHPDYAAERSSPIWHVSRSAMTVEPSQRVLELSLPKMLHHNYWPPREVKTVIPSSALLIAPSSRLHELARHKTFPPLHIKSQSEWDWGEWESDINPAALSATPSQHICSLADPKQTPERYVGPRQVHWDVGKAARNHLASDRTTKLARPKNKHEDTADYDPQTYVVSRSALITQPSPRINQLATPIPRKVRTKK